MARITFSQSTGHGLGLGNGLDFIRISLSSSSTSQCFQRKGRGHFCPLPCPRPSPAHFFHLLLENFIHGSRCASHVPVAKKSAGQIHSLGGGMAKW